MCTFFHILHFLMITKKNFLGYEKLNYSQKYLQKKIFVQNSQKIEFITIICENFSRKNF